MSKTKTILVIAAVAIAALAYSSHTKSSGPGQYDDFAKCLTEKGISMGGTDWCPHCKEQKKYFGKSFKYVDYHNCDYDKAWCASNGVRGYPTWVFPEGVRYSGTKTLTALSTLSGCKLEQNI